MLNTLLHPEVPPFLEALVVIHTPCLDLGDFGAGRRAVIFLLRRCWDLAPSSAERSGLLSPGAV